MGSRHVVVPEQEADDLLLLDVPAKHEVVDAKIGVIWPTGDALASAQEYREFRHVSDGSFKILQRSS
jgi:hypothetical protein